MKAFEFDDELRRLKAEQEYWYRQVLQIAREGGPEAVRMRTERELQRAGRRVSEKIAAVKLVLKGVK